MNGLCWIRNIRMLILINEAENEIDTGQFHLDAKDKRRSRIREKSLKYCPSHLPIVSMLPLACQLWAARWLIRRRRLVSA